MPTQISEVVQHFCRAVLRHDESGLTDGQLLVRFIEQRDEAAVAALVRRHGPMVWGVCRRILHTHHDAEDAFQATFLVLVRKAGSVRNREMVGNWLYGVAHQTALKARAMATKKFARERQVVEMPEPAMKEPDLARELQAVLDQELSRLPDKYRVAIVLCDLEGMPRKAAAQQLGLPEGTLAGRLTRGRAILAKRLARSGLAVSGGTLATLLAQQAASAAVPTSALTSTIAAVSLLAAGQMTAGLISAKVATLTEGMVKAMFLAKLKSIVAVMLILGIMATGATIFTCRTVAGQDDKKPAAKNPVEPVARQEKENDLDVKAEGQRALVLLKQPEKKPAAGLTARIVAPAEVASTSVEFKGELVLTNDGDAAVRICTLCSDGGLFNKIYCPHQWKSDRPPLDMSAQHVVTLAPGKSVALPFGIRSVHYKDLDKFTITASYLVDKDNNLCTKLNLWSGSAKAKPAVVKVVKAGEQDAKPAKEGLTAWGKEAGGLQAGLSLRPGEKRIYRHGEVITLLVRVRNVGKETVKFEYVRQFLDENLPTVTSADGKTVYQPGLPSLGFHAPMDVTLEPGKEIELESRLPLRYEFRPIGEKPTTKERPFFVGTGKVSIQYEQVLGSSSSGTIKLDPALSKLATGKLELEIKKAAPAENEKKGPQKQEPGDQTAKNLWAGMSVNQPLFRAGQNTNLLQFNFALVNESDKVIDPKIPGYPRLIVNGKELDLSSIPGVGPRDRRFKALPPGDNLQFGMGAGQFFDKPGVYQVYWQGEEFRSNEVVFRVTK